MSLVVADGFKTKFETFEEIVSWGNNKRVEVKKIAADKLTHRIAGNFLASIVQIYSYKKLPADLTFDYEKETAYKIRLQSPLLSQIIWDTRRNAEDQKNRMRRNPEYDFRCNIVFIPHGGDIYAIYFGDTPEFCSLISEDEEFEEFWYDGRSDGDETISEEEYDARGQTWNDIFDISSVPSEVGMTLDLLPTIPWEFDESRIFNKIKERYDQFFNLMISDNFLGKEWDDANKEFVEENVELGRYYELVSKFKEFKKSDEGKKRLEELKNQHKETFPTKDSIVHLANLAVDEIFEKLTGEKYEPDATRAED